MAKLKGNLGMLRSWKAIISWKGNWRKSLTTRVITRKHTRQSAIEEVIPTSHCQRGRERGDYRKSRPLQRDGEVNIFSYQGVLTPSGRQLCPPGGRRGGSYYANQVKPFKKNGTPTNFIYNTKGCYHGPKPKDIDEELTLAIRAFGMISSKQLQNILVLGSRINLPSIGTGWISLAGNLIGYLNGNHWQGRIHERGTT